MESTGCYSEDVAEFFYELEFRVSVVNLLRIKVFRNNKLIRQNADSVDAQVISEFCLLNNPTLWKPKSLEQKDLHNINVRISALKAEINRASNALENKNLRQFFPKGTNFDLIPEDEIRQVQNIINDGSMKDLT